MSENTYEGIGKRITATGLYLFHNRHKLTTERVVRLEELNSKIKSFVNK